MDTKDKKILTFGDFNQEKGFKVVNERSMRASAGIMFIMGLVAFINGFLLQNYIVIPYISGILLINFLIGVLINPKFAPIMIIASLIVRGQEPILIGAIQKRFAWSLGIVLSTAIFTISLKLLTDVSFFEPVCFLCLICLIILFFETAFGICVGCKTYYLAIQLKLLKKPEIKPNCMGDSCKV